MRKKEENNMENMVKRWELYCRGFDGYDNYMVIVHEFTGFLIDTEAIRLDVSGKCVLSGEIYGSERFPNGGIIRTSYVKSFERIGSYCRDDVRHDLICANTSSGSKYFFYADNHKYDAPVTYTR